VACRLVSQADLLRAENRRKEDEIRQQQEENDVAAAFGNVEEEGAPELPSPLSLAQQEALIAEPDPVPVSLPTFHLVP
jgi:hypothetical protein